MSDDFVSAAKCLLRERPIDSYRLEHSDHHRRLVIQHGGMIRVLIFPTSTGDAYRGLRNFRAQLRRALDSIGVPRMARVSSPRRNRTLCSAQRSIAPPSEKAAPRADWRDGLRGISIQLFGGEIGAES